MRLSLDQYHKIQQYLDDAMTSEQEKQFVDEVGRNSILQEYLQFELELRQNLALISGQIKTPEIKKEFHDESHIKNLIEKAGNEWQKAQEGKSSSVSSVVVDSEEVKNNKTIFSRLWFSFAAACLALIVFGGIWFMISKTDKTSLTDSRKTDSGTEKSDSKEIAESKTKDSLRQPPIPKQAVNFVGLYKKFYKKDKIPELMPAVLAEALFDYENSDYKKLQNFDLIDLPTLRGGSGKDIDSDQAVKEFGHFYKGLAFLQANNLTQAADNLEWVIDSAKNKQLLIKGQWYQALIHIKKGDTRKAFPLLASVANDQTTPYNMQAKELLHMLKP